MKGVKVEIFDRSLVLKETAFTNDTGTYAFELSLENPDVYLIKISHPGFVSKSFEISTENIPASALKSRFPVIQPDLSLFEFKTGVDYSALEKPLNRYYYDAKKDNYTFDKQLIASSLTELEKIKVAEQNVDRDKSTAMKERRIELLKAAQRQKRTLLSMVIALPVLILILFLVFRLIRRSKNNNLKN
jgi:hypothetical protein